MKNHLIIGLGGTGGKVIRNLRKTIYRDSREAPPEGSRIEYLYIDSSDEHMKINDPEWKVLGKNLQLDPPDQLELKGSDLETLLEDPQSYPAISPWIGDTGDWGPILNLGHGAAKVMGGQKRRLGRLLFARHAQDFNDLLVQKISKLTAGAEAQVTIHIVCGLAGGTGAGILIDIISIIRSSYGGNNAGDYPIIPYLLLPEENPQPNWNTGNYHANGYAALMELNALGVGAYKPHDLLGTGGRYSQLSDPFKISYLITDHNSNGMKFEVDKEIPALIAETIYQKILAQLHGAASKIARIEEWENLDQSHEGALSGTQQKSERSRAFASFGIKKISYPEEEIRDHIGYSLSRQTVLQMLYNNWAQGYLDEELSSTVQGIVGDSTIQQTFNIDQPSFFLERPFSSNSDETDQLAWKPIDEDWRNYIEQIAGDIIESGEENWIASLRKSSEERFKGNYRNNRGVLDYYSWKTDRVDEYARDMANSIDSILCNDLVAGKRSLVEIKAILDAIAELLDRRQSEWQQQNEEDMKVVNKERTLWMENMQRFADLGPLAKIMPRCKHKIFNAGKDSMTRYLCANTRIAGWEFAKLLLQALIREVNSCSDKLQGSITALRNAVSQCDESIADHTPEEKPQDSERVCLRLYNGDEVTRYRDALISNREFQDLQSRQARNDMHEQLMKGRSSLQKLPSPGDMEPLLDILEKSSHATLESYDADTGGEHHEGVAFDRLFSVSILNKLEERYAGDAERMREEIKDFLVKAGSLLQINQSEAQKQGPGTIKNSENQKITLLIIMPEADAEEGFARTLREVMTASVPDGTHIDFVDAGSRRHEIVVLRFIQLFPLRYADVLKRLRKEYQDRMKENPSQRALEVHTEDDGNSYPPLFIPSVEQQVAPLLFLGLATGAIRPKTGDGNAQEGTLGALVIVDDDDAPLLELGTGYPDALRALGVSAELARLTSQITARVTRIKDEPSSLNAVREKLRPLAKEISKGDDDNLRKFIDFAKNAEDELDSLAGS